MLKHCSKYCDSEKQSPVNPAACAWGCHVFLWSEFLSQSTPAWLQGPCKSSPGRTAHPEGTRLPESFSLHVVLKSIPEQEAGSFAEGNTESWARLLCEGPLIVWVSLAPSRPQSAGKWRSLPPQPETSISGCLSEVQSACPQSSSTNRASGPLPHLPWLNWYLLSLIHRQSHL